MSDDLVTLQEFCSKFHHISAAEKVVALHDLISSKGDICVYVCQLLQSGVYVETIQLLKCIQDMPSVLQELTCSSFFEELLRAASESKNKNIQCLLLKPFRNSVINYPECFSNSSVLKNAVDWIESDDLELSELSSETVQNLLVSFPSLLSTGLEFIMAAARRVTSDSVLLLRFCQVLSRLSRVSDLHFQEVLNHGGVNLVLDQCRGSDILVNMLAMELLIDFANTSAGLSFLLDAGHVHWLTELACGSGDDDYPDPLCGGQALRTLGQIVDKASKLNVQIWESPDDERSSRLGHSFVRALLRHVESADEAALLIGLHALADFAASSAKAARVVLQDSALRDAWFSLISRKTELQAAALRTVARVLDSDESVASPAESAPIPSLVDLKRDLFHSIGAVRNQDSMNYLLKLAREPILILKYAAYDVLRSLAKQPSGWGLELLLGGHGGSSTPWSFLQDVGAEYEKQAKEWKFSVIEALANNPKVNLLTEELKTDIMKRLRQGPFFAHARLAEMQTMEH